MNIEHIRSFLEVVSTGSFQQAAEDLNITQSTMSARIKTLEESLNRQLFNRKRTGVSLTSGGQAFYSYALSVVRVWETARTVVGMPDGFDSHVKLGLQLNHWSAIASPWINWMEENCAGSVTQVRSDYSDRLMALLRDGEIDVAVLYEAKKNPGLVVENYGKEKLVLVGTTARAVCDSNVPGYVYVDWGRRFRLDHAHAFPNTRNHRLFIGLAAVALEHVLTRGGSGYFMQSQVEQYLEDGRLVRVKDAPVLELQIHLAYFQEGDLSAELLTAIQGLHSVRQQI